MLKRKIWLWKDWAEWQNWQTSQGNSHQQTRNQLGTPDGRWFSEGGLCGMYENNDYAYNMPKTFWGEKKVFPWGRSLPLVTGRFTRWIGMQKSRCRLDWYMGIYSVRLLVCFLLDIMKSSLVGLDISLVGLEFCLGDWLMLGKSIRQTMFGQWKRVPNSTRGLTMGDWKDTSSVHPQ